MCASNTTLAVRSTSLRNWTEDRTNVEDRMRGESWESQGAKGLAQFSLEQRS